jgi:hypothetical protein
MPLEVKIWRIRDNRLQECPRSSLDMEERIEEWLENDISLISGNLLVIGRQVGTAYGGIIDLLCIDDEGDLAIVELKRDLTPRDVTAQALDYASWIRDLSGEAIRNIANEYLKGRGTLEDIFQDKFESELPDALNSSHKMFIVASEIDPSTERIIRYLSDTYGVNINAVTFNYFKNEDREFVSRVFLIEPNQVDYSTRTKGTTKRFPNLTYEQVEDIVKEKGIENLYIQLMDNLTNYLGRHTTRSTVAFETNIDGGRRTVFSVLPKESNRDQGLCFQVNVGKLAKETGKKIEELKGWFPKENRFNEDVDSKGNPRFNGFFKTKEQIDLLIQELQKIKWAKVPSKSI